LLGQFDRLVDRQLELAVDTVAHLVERDAHHVAIERRDPLHRPVLGVAPDPLVELLAMLLDSLGQLARERPRAGQELRERAPGHVVLVAGEDGVTALVGAAHRAPAYARETYSPLRVSTRIRSPSSMKS